MDWWKAAWASAKAAATCVAPDRRRMPRFSVLILNWNGRDLLPGCLDSLRAQTFRDFEAIVVDNGSGDGSAEYVAAAYPEVTLLALPTNTGFCGGNNAGYARASGELVVLLNNDAELREDFLAEMDAAAVSPSGGSACSPARS